jgi:transcriptional regulator with XRE-family HTH domain
LNFFVDLFNLSVYNEITWIGGEKMSNKTSDLKTRLRYALDLRDKRASDLVNDLHIPKSAISQYLSGKSQNMDSERLFKVCKYLNVSEPWLLGYDVPMGKSPAPAASKLTEAEETLLGLFRQVPEDQQELVLHMIQAALKSR